MPAQPRQSLKERAQAIYDLLNAGEIGTATSLVGTLLNDYGKLELLNLVTRGSRQEQQNASGQIVAVLYTDPTRQYHVRLKDSVTDDYHFGRSFSTENLTEHGVVQFLAVLTMTVDEDRPLLFLNDFLPRAENMNTLKGWIAWMSELNPTYCTYGEQYRWNPTVSVPMTSATCRRRKMIID